MVFSVNVKPFVPWVAVCLSFAVWNAGAATHYVNLDSTGPLSPYTNWATAATNINDAILAASDADTILVTNGVYDSGLGVVGSNRVYVSKAVLVKSVSGPAVTIIKGTTNGTDGVRCVYLTTGAALSGFTLTNGGGGTGGGVACAGNDSVISNCVITGNARSGCYLGIYVNCTIAGNVNSTSGGGGTSGYYTNCLVIGNSAASDGGGLYYPGAVVNCTVVSNYSSGMGGGVYAGALRNSIIYYNNGSGSAANAVNYAPIDHCCTPGTLVNGCITNAPMFVDLNGDFRLQTNSPCINAGANSAITTALDFAGHARVSGQVVDIGAYEFVMGTNLTHYVNVNSPNPIAPYATLATAATNIQDAVAAANANEWVLVTNGWYQYGFGGGSNRVYISKPMTVKSMNGPGVTTIKGYQQPGTTNGLASVRCVSIAAAATLSGFTLLEGATLGTGGGVSASSGAIITNCLIRENTGGGCYGGAYINCFISNNGETANGGGGYLGAYTNCVISHNYCTSEGGGTYYANYLVNCTVVSNHCGSDGGGVYGGILKNCIVYYNQGFGYTNVSNLSGADHCCIPDNWGYITNPPAFINVAFENYRFQTNSPCINSGNNAGVTTAADLDGNPRVAGGTVDIGAYEFQAPSSVLSYAYLQKYGLPADGSADYADTDGDGMNNWREWKCGTSPVSASSVLAMQKPVVTTNTTVNWSCVVGNYYYVQRSTNAAGPFLTLATNILAWTGTTNYIDKTATNSAAYFYRVGVQ